MPSPEQAMENSYQTYLRHIRFVETQKSLNLPPEKRSPPCPEATIRRGWEAMCLRAGQRKEESRKRAGVPLDAKPTPQGRPMRAPPNLQLLTSPPGPLSPQGRGGGSIAKRGFAPLKPQIPKPGLKPGSVPMP